MEQTWIAIVGSLLMGVGAAFLLVYSVERNHFLDLDENNLGVSWRDANEMADTGNSGEESRNG